VERHPHLFNCNEGVGELRWLSEEELEERGDAVALQMEDLAPSLNYATRIAAYRAELMRREVVLQRQRMEELTANLVRQREQMQTLNGTLNRLLRVMVFAAVVGVLIRRLRPWFAFGGGQDGAPRLPTQRKEGTR
jgi:predicted RNase H-like nuclease (RuvC/YqgF family)